MYLILMNASGPPCFSNASRVSWINSLEYSQSLVYWLVTGLPDVLPLLLRVVDSVAAVEVHVFENVQDGENLAVVGNQSFANDIGRDDEVLEDLQCRADGRSASRVQSVFNRNDQLGNNLRIGVNIPLLKRKVLPGRIFDPPCSSIS